MWALGDVPAAFWTALAALVAAIAGAIGTVRAARAKARVDVQTTINDGFAKLVENLNKHVAAKDAELTAVRAERDAAQRRCAELEVENARLRDRSHRKRSEDRHAQDV